MSHEIDRLRREWKELDIEHLALTQVIADLHKEAAAEGREIGDAEAQSAIRALDEVRARAKKLIEKAKALQQSLPKR